MRVAAGVAEPLLDLLRGAAGAVADQRMLDELAQRRRAVARGERRAGRDDQHVRVGEQLDRLVGAGLDRQHDEAEVELAALDEVDQVRGRRPTRAA